MSEAHPSVEGRCLCHAVRFRIELPTLWCAHCHCSRCRQAHGAAFVTWVGVAEEQFSFMAGKGAVTWFDSSPEAQRGFCRECGSSMFFRSERWAGEVHVTLANLAGPIDREPQAHAYWQSHVPWFEPADSLPRREG